MDSSELHRKLLYCGYTDLTDYIKDSPTNRYIYKLLLDIRTKHKIEVPILKIFNEIYYQCVRIHSDGNPGEDVSRRYLDEEEIWLGSNSGHTNLLVFCLVSAILKRKTKLIFNEECFLQQLDPLIEGCEYISVGNDLTNYMVSNNIFSPYEFKTMPCPINEIPMRIDLEYHTTMTFFEKVKKWLSLPVESSAVDFNPWRKVTDNFSESAIRWYVDLYTTRQDQLRLLERIERACTKDEYAMHQGFFNSMKLYIRGGYRLTNSLGYQMLPKDFVYASDDWKLDESQWLMFNTQIEELMKQIDEQQTNYKLELARVEAKYQAEVAELKRQLEQKANEEENVQRVEYTPSHPKQGQSLMIDEMVKHVKQRFSKSAAEEFCTMYYHLAMEHGGLDEETSKLVDSIVPAILQRDVPQPTLNIDTATQVNLGPKEVNNYFKEEQ